MSYFSVSSTDQAEMLRTIGVESIEELFDCVPKEHRLTRPLALPPALTELELDELMQQLGNMNQSAQELVCFLGAGCYDHFIPAVVDVIASRSEFYTCYTPYQPEASQGTLQAMFEYQTMVAELTGMDVANASMYDGASALAEAILMSTNLVHNRKRILLPETLHPEYRQVVTTYLVNTDFEVVTAPAADGVVDLNWVEQHLDDRTVCLVVQHPNFFGCLEPVEQAVQLAHRHGALAIVVVDPISLGLLKRPGDYGADIVVAEGQPLGIPMQYGGPFLGILATRQQFVRRLPGRLVGQTVDRRGQRCWVLTLQTREQHIRREKATSNICTNQALMALRAAVYLAAIGPEGLRNVAELCVRKANYAFSRLCQLEHFEPVFDRPVFKEFLVRYAGNRLNERLSKATAAGYLPGLAVEHWYPELSNCLLVAVTEKRSKQQIDRLVELLS